MPITNPADKKVDKKKALERIFVYQAVEYGYLSEEQLYECIKIQESMTDPKPLLTVCKEKKYLTPSQASHLMSRRLDRDLAKAVGDLTLPQAPPAPKPSDVLLMSRPSNADKTGVMTATGVMAATSAAGKEDSTIPITSTSPVTSNTQSFTISPATPQKDREEFERLIAEKNKTLEREQKQREFFRRQVDQLQEELAKIRQEKQTILDTKQKEISDLQSEIIFYKGLDEQKDQQIKKLQSVVEERETYIRREQQKSKNLSLILDQGAQELRDAEDQRVKLETDCERLQKELEFLNSKIDKEKNQARQDIQTANQQLQEQQQKFNSLQVSYDELRRQLMQSTGQKIDTAAIATQKSDIASKSQAQNQLLTNLQSHGLQYEELATQLTRLTQELDTAKRTIDDKRQLQERYEKELSQKEEELHRVRISLEAELSQYKQRSEVLDTKLKQFQDSLKNWDEVQQQSAQYKKQAEEGQKERHDLEEQKKHLEVKVQDLTKRLQQFQHVPMTAEGDLSDGTLLPGSEGQYYTIQKMLGRGGMGIAYKAIRGSDEKVVVIKTLLPESAKDLKVMMRFVQESRILIDLEHDNIVKGYDLHQDRDLLYFVMEYIDGCSVEKILEEQAFMDPVQATHIILDIANCLQYLEMRHRVHRDIKPANILLTSKGIAKLVDFGIVKMTDRDYSLTTQGIILGTPYYLSPEQTCQTNVDIRSDIYNLGATYYHMVVGEVPFPGDNPLDVIRQRLEKDAPRPDRAKPDLPKPVCEIIRKMMSRKPDNRYKRSAELVKDLQDVYQKIQPKK